MTFKTNSTGRFITPLRYPGGKGRLGPWLGQVIESNGLKGGWYVEPYAGGAGAALYLLKQEFVDQIVINDADPVICAFWTAITEHTDAFIDKILSTPVTIENRFEQLQVIAQPQESSILDIGFAAFFLNRTNRSGILAGGVIGGKLQNGEYKLTARFNKDDLISRIKAIGQLSNRIMVTGMDAMDLLASCSPGFPTNTLVYLDPPYYVKGSQLYRNYYDSGDHAAIANYLKTAEYPLLVTYDDCPEINALYRGMKSTTFSLHYSTHTARPKTSEVMFYANVDIPHSPKLTRAQTLKSTDGDINENMIKETIEA